MKRGILTLFLLFTAIFVFGQGKDTKMNNYETATIGGGCFWCIEAVYERTDGIIDVVSGYAGGKTKNPTYYEVSAGNTGHAEVTQITFDPEKISYDDILDLFWKAHDPTTLNSQGADRGTQYRSIILYENNEQKKTTEKSIERLRKSGYYRRDIVTEVKPLEVFYPAEDYHQDYFAKNPNAGYCRIVIQPKLEKLGLFND